MRLRYHFAKSEARSPSDTTNVPGSAGRGKVFPMSRFYTDGDGDGDDVYGDAEALAAAPRQLRLSGAGPLLGTSSDVDGPDNDFAVPGRIVSQV